MPAPTNVSDRLGRLRSTLVADEAGAEALLVSGLSNIRYLTDFSGSAGLVFVLPNETVLLVDGRYGTQAGEQLTAASVNARVEVAGAARQSEVAGAIVGGAAVTRLALEAEHVTWARQRSFAADWFPGLELLPTVGLVEGLRRVKDPGEVDRIAEAARIADAALDTVRPMLEERPEEREVAMALDFEMRRLGASGPSFETIVASGPNAAKPHHRPGGRRVESGELVVLDFGALYDGYCSDMTRTVWAGEIADPKVRRMLELVSASQAAGVGAVRAGARCEDVDRTCRDLIADAGFGDRFVHGTGHGVGLDIHEAPSVAATSTDTLVVGNVVTVEPGVYIPGFAGARVEDTVVVTEDGCRPLTLAPKDSF